MVRTAHQVGSYVSIVSTEDRIPQYEIRVRGQLGSRWAAWFDGLDLSTEDGMTVIRGAVVDQAALHGLLQKLRDIGLPLVSLSPLPLDGRN